MATVDKSGTVTIQELLVTSLAQIDAVAKLLNEICWKKTKKASKQDQAIDEVKTWSPKI